MRVAEAVGRLVSAAGPRHPFGVVGSGNFSVTNALVAAGTRFVAARHEGGARRWPMRTPDSAVSWASSPSTRAAG